MHDGCRTLARVSTVLEGPRVREIVAATPLGRGDLVAGRAGLDRTVALARLVDVPGLDDGSPGALLLARGVGPLVGTAGCLIVERLVGGGAAGLAIARGHYLGTVHRRVRARADEVGLPILTLPLNSRLGEIADAVEAAVLDRRYQALRHADGVQRALSRILLGGGDLPALIERASELLGNPLVLLDADGRRLAASPDAGYVPRLDDLDLAAGAQEIELGEDRRLLVAQVPGASGAGGSLALVPRRPFGPYDETALDHVASLVAVELLRGQQLRLAEDRLRADLVRDALAAREPADDLAARARALGADFDAPQVAVTAGVDDLDAVLARLGRSGTGAREAAVRVLVSEVEAALGRVALVARDGDSAVALLPAEFAGDLRDRLAAAATALAHVEPGVVLAAGWGRAAPLGEHARSLAEARRARALGAALRSGGAHGYEDVAVYDALLGEGAPGAARQLAAHTLGPLTPELRRTLEVHLQGGLSVARTAEALYLHRNTVRYRLGQIERLTARRLDVLEDRLVLEIGVVAARLAT
jgi:PucR family transcriptional regulator, purine catabolism regulatory protein